MGLSNAIVSTDEPTVGLFVLRDFRMEEKHTGTSLADRSTDEAQAGRKQLSTWASDWEKKLDDLADLLFTLALALSLSLSLSLPLPLSVCLSPSLSLSLCLSTSPSLSPPCSLS
jgi:hypothetical protein